MASQYPHDSRTVPGPEPSDAPSGARSRRRRARERVPGTPPVSLVPVLLVSVAALVAALTCVLVGIELADLRSAGEVSPQRLAQFVLHVVAGVGLSGALFGLWAVRAQVGRLERHLGGIARRLADAFPTETPLRSLEPQRARGVGTESTGPARVGDTLQMIELLEDIRDTQLMSPEQRRQRLERLQARRWERVRQKAHSLLVEERFTEALELVERFEDQFGVTTETAALADEIRQRHRVFEAEHLARAEKKIADLQQKGQWDEAAAVVEDLMTQLPGSEAAAALRQRFHEQRRAFLREQRLSLHRTVQEHIQGKRWREALEAARRFLEAYPDAPEAADLRAQISTLEFNAEVQTRREMEEEIKLLIKSRQFAEAVAIAEDLIDRYPNSPQAQVLRDQLPRLRERAGIQGPAGH